MTMKQYGKMVEGATLYDGQVFETDADLNDYLDWKSEAGLRDAENGVTYERQIDAWAFMRGQD